VALGAWAVAAASGGIAIGSLVGLRRDDVHTDAGVHVAFGATWTGLEGSF
jgi:hypothetical protein